MPTPPLLHSLAAGIHPAAFIEPAAPGVPRDGHLRVDPTRTPWALQVYSAADAAWHDVGVSLPIPPSSGGAITKIADVTLGAAAASWTSPSLAGYASVEVIARARGDVAATAAHMWLQLNGDTAAHYTSQSNYAHLATTTLISDINVVRARCGLHCGATAPAGFWSTLRVLLPDASNTDAFHSFIADGWAQDIATASCYRTYAAGQWSSTAAVTSITLLPDSGNWLAGSHFAVYGYS